MPKKIDTQHDDTAEAARLLLRAFSTCANWPHDRDGMVGLAEELQGASIRFGIPMAHIVESCKENSPLCPTPHDLLNAGRQLWTRKNETFEAAAAVKQRKQWEKECGPADLGFSNSLIQRAVEVVTDPRRDDELWKSLRQKFPESRSGRWPSWQILAVAAHRTWVRRICENLGKLLLIGWIFSTPRVNPGKRKEHALRAWQTQTRMEPNDSKSPQAIPPPYTLVGGPENIKLLFDEVLDNRRETLARARAWEAISLDMAQTASRRAQNSATIDHAINAGMLISGQVGATEGQQTVSPAGTAASETTKGAVAAAGAGEAVSAEAVTANVANLFTALTPVIASALATALAQSIAALVPVVITAAGGASTPSQTSSKPTA